MKQLRRRQQLLLRRREFQLLVAEWRIQPSIAEHSETQPRRVHPDLLRLWQAWAQILLVPRQEDHSYARKSTDSRRRTSPVYSSSICKPWNSYPPEERKSYQRFYHRDRRVLSWVASALTLFDDGATRFFCFLFSSKKRESALNLGDEILVRGSSVTS
jgi:hypothetical protein